MTTCPDPHGWLDTPGRPLDLESRIGPLRQAGLVDHRAAEEMASLIHELAPHVTAAIDVRFLHDDTHAFNVMCTRNGELLALIDWGDAGWGDPTLDFVGIPLEHVPGAVEGYQSESSSGLGEFPEARFIWDKLHYAMRRLAQGRGEPPPLDAYRRYLRAAGR